MNATQEYLQRIIDYTRGELDRENSLGAGYSGPINQAYMDGYGIDHRPDHSEQDTQKEAMQHGWH